MSVKLRASGTALEGEVPLELFAVPLRLDPIRNQYAVTGDGSKFFVLESTEQGSGPMTVVLNWTSRLGR